MNNSVQKYYNEIKDHLKDLDLPSNIILTVVIGVFLLWIVLGFSGSIMVIILLVTNIVCLYYLHQTKQVK